MDVKKQTYFLFILCGIEVGLVVCSLLGNVFGSVLGITGVLFRIILLVCSACCIPGAQWAAFYSIISLIYCLYSFDPVGLFLIGHGQAKTLFQNIMCLTIVVGLGIASYVGYLYKRELENSQGEQENGNYEMNFGNNNNQYGSNYQQPYLQNQRNSQQQKNNFAPFQGQGYSLY